MLFGYLRKIVNVTTGKTCLILILVFEVLLLFAGCAKKPSDTLEIKPDDIMTIEALFSRHGTDVIYLEESGEYVPFLIIDDDYNGNILLLRQDVLETPMKYNEYQSAYEGSSIDIYLNSVYLTSLSDTNLMICDTDIVVTAAESIGTSGKATSVIERKVFLLSMTELGYNDSYGATHEGTPLEYFQNVENRIATLNGRPTSWWTRSAETYHNTAVYGVGPDGALGNGNASDENGIRPAFCVPKESVVTLSTDIVQGESVFVLDACI